MKIIKKICPICILVSGTWLIMFWLRSFGYQVEENLLTMLMGGSVVGVSYTLGKKVVGSEMLWKLFSIPTGFGTMLALINYAWGWFAVLVSVYFVLWLIFRSGKTGHLVGRDYSKGEVISKELKNCC